MHHWMKTSKIWLLGFLTSCIHYTWRFTPLGKWDHFPNPTEFGSPLSTSSNLTHPYQLVILSFASFPLCVLGTPLSVSDCCVTIGCFSAAGMSVLFQWQRTFQRSDPRSASPVSANSDDKVCVMIICSCNVITLDRTY